MNLNDSKSCGLILAPPKKLQNNAKNDLSTKTSSATFDFKWT
jgi:hypothetical protein